MRDIKKKEKAAFKQKTPADETSAAEIIKETDREYQAASEIIELAQTRLYLAMPSLALPLGLLHIQIDPQIKRIGCNGRTIRFNPQWVLDAFNESTETISAYILHQLIHCIFLHPFEGGISNDPEEKKRWDLSCDIFAWHMVDQLLKGSIPASLLPLCESCSQYISNFTEASAESTPAAAQLIFNHLSETPNSEHTPVGKQGSGSRQKPAGKQECTEKICLDDHSLWDKVKEEDLMRKTLGSGHGEGCEALSEIWRAAAAQSSFHINAPSKKRGRGTGSERTAVSLSHRKNINYAGFLKRFSTLKETVSPNPDEFQYSYYMYGLSQYGNIPLIEPLEYKEEYRLEELVIAIDTSASCSRDLTKMFLEETRNIIYEDDLFFRRFDLRIIQCDSEIKQVKKITNLTAFADYIDNLQIIGGGGTDFRPPFQYIKEEQAKGQLPRLKGMLYFTDGYGVFPKEITKYEVVFVFLKYRYDDIDVPPWAKKLILEAGKPAGTEAVNLAGWHKW